MKNRMIRLAGLLGMAAMIVPAFAQEKPAAGTNAPQSEVATKGSFTTIAVSSPEVKNALDAKDLAGGKKKGEAKADGAFQGTVSEVFAPKSNSVVILNFAPKYKEAMTAAVQGKNFKKFPDLKSLKGKRVLISGKFAIYRDAPEILLTDPAQIKIITEK